MLIYSTGYKKRPVKINIKIFFNNIQKAFNEAKSTGNKAKQA